MIAPVSIYYYSISRDNLQVLSEKACRTLADMLGWSSVEVVRQSGTGRQTRGGPGAEHQERVAERHPRVGVSAK
jgi:hypothetical protein